MSNTNKNCTIYISSELKESEIKCNNLDAAPSITIKCSNNNIYLTSLIDAIEKTKTDFIQIVTQKVLYKSPDLYYLNPEYPLIINRLLLWERNTYNILPYSITECSGAKLEAREMISCMPFDDSIIVWENKILSKQILSQYVSGNPAKEMVSFVDILNFLSDLGLSFYIDKRKLICIEHIDHYKFKMDYNVAKNPEIREIVGITQEFKDFRLDILKKEIEKNDVISFDIFDTLLVRPTWKPDDVFLTVQDYVNSILQPVDYIEFVDLRKNAEQIARNRNYEHNKTYEVTYGDIYDVLGEIFPFSKEHLSQIYNYELCTEKKFLKPRLSALALLKYALCIKKVVILTSDMYFEQKELRYLLNNLGIDLSEIRLFISSEYKKSKYNGELFQIIKKQYENRLILHIGDNYEVDYCNAIKAGINAFHLPSTIACMKGDDPSCGSMIWHRVYGVAHDPISSENFNRFSGLRSINAVAANHIFDNPFEYIILGSEISGNAYNIGYYFLGSYIISFAQRVIEKYDTGQYSAVNLIARDCFVLKEAIKIIRPDIPVNYVRLSRLALTPLCIREVENGVLLRNSGVFTSVSPLDFVDMYSNVLVKDKKTIIDTIQKNGFIVKKKFSSFEEYSSFCSFFSKQLIDYNSVKKEANLAKRYFDQFFGGHTLFVDLGYSYRAELILKQLYGYNMDTLYIHTNSDSAYLRSNMVCGNIDCIIPFYPHEAVWVREKMSSELSPSCIGYEEDKNGEVIPKLDETFSTNEMQRFYLNTIQKASLEFVSEFVSFYDYQNGHYYYPSFLGMLSFEKFFYDAKDLDRMIFGTFHFEDKNGMGSNLNLKEIWDNYHKHTEFNNYVEKFNGPYVELNHLSKLQRSLFFFLFEPRVFIKKLKKNIKGLLHEIQR